MGDPDLLHRTDFFAWTKEQAEALRAAGRAATPFRTNRPVDWANVAEEIESLGRSLRGSLASQVRRIIHHLLKLQFAAAEPPRAGWRRSIREARVEADDLLDENPSLRPEIGVITAKQWGYAVTLALADLDEHGETAAAARLRAEARPYDPSTEILADWWPERVSV